ncbi:MAG: glycosyl hydrolase [Candidatus Azobacteroides sp.]|nr:glycosyl hydrolase [Candidatus Azobacteroides sp.]
MKKEYLFICILFIAVTTGLTAQTKSYKRGVGTNNIYPQDLRALEPGLSWMYNWGIGAPAGIEDIWEDSEVEFIPMIWSGSIGNYTPDPQTGVIPAEATQNSLREYLQAHPSIKYILGFNEPNFTTQAALTPTEAARIWPEIEKIADEFGLTIVGPAPNYCGNCVEENGIVYSDPVKYYEDFFAACPDCRVDHIAIHLYMPGGLETTIEKLKKFNRPIWLTEFNYNSGGNGTEDDQIRFIVKEFEYLEKEPFIYRYAWFMARSTVTTINLLGRFEGLLTELGNVFVNMSSFDENYYFVPEQQIPAEHFISSDGITLASCTDETGALMVKEVQTGNYMDYLIDAGDGGDFYLKLRMACNGAGQINVYSDDELITEYNTTATGGLTVWGMNEIPVRLKAGKQRIRIMGMGRLFYLNWLQLSQTSNIRQTLSSFINITYNNASGKIYIQSDKEIEKTELYDLSGKLVANTYFMNEIETGNLPGNMYLVKVYLENGEVYHDKIIKN